MNLSSFIIPKFEFFFSLLSSTPGQIVYWLFVFCVTVAFAAILIAQFETSFNTLSNRAKMNIVLKKLEIMRKMERFRDVFGCVFRKIPFVSYF